MRRVMVRYTVKPERVAENERYIKKVFEELGCEKPTGLSYGSFKLSDGVSFVHIVSDASSDQGSRLGEFPAFKAFTAGIEERCDEAPVATRLEEVGSYRVFGD
jgi:hypothetical protein